MHLAEIKDLVIKHWPWTPKSYPILGKMRKTAREAFKRQHLLLHLGKQLGKLAAVQEYDDHGNATFLNNRVYLIEHLAKMLTTLLHLAHVMGITAEELEKYIHDFYKPEARPASR